MVDTFTAIIGPLRAMADKGLVVIRINVSGWLFLLVPAHPGSPGKRVVNGCSNKVILDFSHSGLIYILLPSSRSRFLKPIFAGYIYRESKKENYTLVHIFAKYWPIFIILSPSYSVGNKIINKDPTSPQMCCYTTLWNAEVVVWPFTSMNSYWIPHALAQKWLTE